MVSRPRRGLRNGDVLVAVGATQVSSLGTSLDDQLSELSNRIDGAAGTAVTLTVDRAGAQLVFTITARTPGPHRVQPDVRQRPRPPGDQLRGGHRQDAVRPEERAGRRATAVVLDLRGNGGGYVTWR